MASDTSAKTNESLPPYGKLENESTIEGQAGIGVTFFDAHIRRSFIRKVYGILMCQLLVNIAIIAFFMYHEPTKYFVLSHIWLYLAAYVVLLVLIIVVVCCGEIRRKYPINLILLGLFTVVDGFMLGCISIVHEASEVFIAVGITAALVLALTLFAFQTKWDFTTKSGILFTAFIILVLFGITAASMPSKALSLLYSSAGALIFSIYIVYDTQLMMGGFHKYALSPEEYVFAALNLYVDIINLLLMILGITRRS